MEWPVDSAIGAWEGLGRYWDGTNIHTMVGRTLTIEDDSTRAPPVGKQARGGGDGVGGGDKGHELVG